MLTNGPRTAWSNQPPTVNWDPAMAVRWRSETSRGGKFVPLGTLLKATRQGVVVAGLDSGDIAVEMARVTDVQQIIPGTGERRFVSPSILRRHMVETGDVLVARVGRPGQACCILSDATPIVPREGLLVARPKRREWGPAISAALCTPTVKNWLSQLPTGSCTATLTKEQLSEIPVPSPARFDFGQIADLVDRAGALAREGKEVLGRVRGRVGLLLENAPTAVLPHDYLWLADPDVLQGWCWQEVQRYWLRDRAQWQVRGLKPLHEVIEFSAHRPRTVVGDQPSFMLAAEDIRPDWYLALPDLPNRQEAESTPARAASATQRFFAVDRECLLIPTVGDIVAEPVVVPEEVFNHVAVPLMVPIHWLPLASLRYPRALAVVLDHPFVRLQRRLGGAFSTVPHITREEIGSLLVPAVSEEKWRTWEEELRRAHSLFIEASAKAKQAVAIVEEWYS